MESEVSEDDKIRKEYTRLIEDHFGISFGMDPAAKARADAVKALNGDGDRILAAVNRIYAATTCRACGTPLTGAIMAWAELSHVPLSPTPYSGGGLGGSYGLPPALPCIVVQCMTCGLTNLHDAEILGLIPSSKKHSVSKTK